MLLIVTFFLSLITSWVILQLSQSKNYFVNDIDLEGVQKFHKVATPRIGGVSIFIGLSVALFLLEKQPNLLLLLWLSSLPVLIVGLYEDFSARVSPLTRLISAFFSILIVFLSLNVGVFSLGFELVDYLLSNYVMISLLLTF